MKNCKWAFYLIIGLSTMIVSCSSEEEVIIEEPDPIDIEGNYTGGWTSRPENGSVYDNIPISATLTSTDDATKYEGDFFFTSIFTSCCASGNSDGPITMEIIDSEITTFEYMDILPGCNGNFKGSGTVGNSGRLTIQFTGGDCEGEHRSASLFLVKQ